MTLNLKHVRDAGGRAYPFGVFIQTARPAKGQALDIDAEGQA